MKTIFIVDPDKMLATVYTNALDAEDRNIISFRTANLAVKALEKVIPDVVLLELALPAHNGFELLYELRSYHDTRNVAVVINSFVQESQVPFGYVTREDMGIVDYLHKSFASLDDIRRSVASALHGEIA